MRRTELLQEVRNERVADFRSPVIEIQRSTKAGA